MRKIGIMGGTFNPIHNGHLMLADQARIDMKLDLVIFVPSGTPPHKKTSDAMHRLMMTRLALASNKYFSLSDYEVNKDEVDYSIDTVKYLKSKFPDDEFYFILGGDMIMDLDKWKDFKLLAKQVGFIAANRGGMESSKILRKADILRKMHSFDITILNTSLMELSSSEIRDRVNKGKSIKYLVKDEVESYIYDNELFVQHHTDYFEIKNLLKKSISPQRYLHSKGVAKAARELCVWHGLDLIKGELAGLAHDYAKEMPEKSAREYAKKLGLLKFKAISDKPQIAHGEIGAYILQKEGLITDEEILDAIRWHTYGNGEMSDIAKAVYIADIIEENRPPYPGRDEVRQVCYKSLDKALIVWHQFALKKLEKRKEVAHPYMFDMINSIKKNIKKKKETK